MPNDDTARIALLSRTQPWFVAAAVLALLACIALRVLGITGTPLLVAYVAVGTSVTLAACAYFRANILRHGNAPLIPAGFLAMSLAIVADQVSGGVIMGFSVPLTVACAVIALLSLSAIALLGQRR